MNLRRLEKSVMCLFVTGLLVFSKVGFAENSPSSIPASFIKCRCKPIFNGVFPWTGKELRETSPVLE
jgi:hypothetical protein